MKVTIVGFTGGAGSGKDTIAQGIIEARGFKKVSFADPLYRLMKLEVAKEHGDKAAPYEMFKLCLELFGGPLYAPSVKELAIIVQDEFSRISSLTGLMKDVEAGTKPRMFLQYVGTDFFRKFDPDVWVDYFINRTVADVMKIREDHLTAIETGETKLRATGSDTMDGSEGVAITAPNVRLVITDIRFNNEADMFYRLIERLNAIAPDIVATKYLIKLDLPVEDGAKRVAARDDVTVEAVMANMGHTSEAGVSNCFIDYELDASRSISAVGNDVLRIIDGTYSRIVGVVPATVLSGTDVIDLSQYAKKKGIQDAS